MKHTYIYVKQEHYLLYQEKYGHTRLDKWNRILPPASLNNVFSVAYNKIYEEIFEGIETQYTLTKNNNNYLILFRTNKSNKYRFDLLSEPNTKIYDLAFSDSSNDLDDVNKYEELTDRKESIEVLSRLSWILKDVTLKINVDEYCIGATGIQGKDNIYLYMMRFASNWEKRYTKKYPLGWALYFTI